MKFRIWVNLLITIVLLIFSGYLLADSSLMSLALFSNPNLDVPTELIRLFWGIVGLFYFLYYLYKDVEILFFQPATVSGTIKSVHHKKTKRRKHRKSSRKTSKSKTK